MRTLLIFLCLFATLAYGSTKEKITAEDEISEDDIIDIHNDLMRTYFGVLSDPFTVDPFHELLKIIDMTEHFDINNYDAYKIAYENETYVICSYKDRPYDYGQCVHDNKIWQVCCFDGWRSCDVCSAVICC